MAAIDAVAIALILSRYPFEPNLADSAEEVWSTAIAIVSEHVRVVVEPTITPELLRGERLALDAFDEMIRSQGLHVDAAGVMLGTMDGVVVYSLDHDTVGHQFVLPAHVRDSVGDGASSATFGSLLGRADSQITGGPLPTIEVVSAARGPDGESLVWQENLRWDDVPISTSNPRVRVAVGGALLLMAQGVLVGTLFHRREQERRQRGWLTQRTSELNLAERRRFAADLHNGALQDLTGMVLDLDRPAPGGESTGVADRTEIAVRLRQAIGSLRTAMSAIYPSEQAVADVPTAISACLDRMDPHLTRHLAIDPLAVVRPEYRWLTIRVAQEAVWNVVVHARADAVTVGLRREGHHVVLTVQDDGIGFDPELTRSQPDHMGLALLADMAAAAGAALTVASAPGAGTTVRLEVPA
ncbi:MAG TPA: ATP-binding protein [Ilumatobacteraceae bacterium]|nr:ATP-binding protein [Ilumatobacteraceae bacterium]